MSDDNDPAELVRRFNAMDVRPPTCGRCRHWSAGIRGIGRCMAIPTLKAIEQTGNETAFLTGVANRTALFTRDTFGCTLHEAAPADAPAAP